MRASIEDLVRAVSATLRADVLPKLEARDWPASRLRSSLQLLELIEDRVVNERRVLIGTNALMRDFLTDVASGKIPTPEGWPRGQGDTLAPFAAFAPGADLAELTEANETYKLALGRLIREAGAARARTKADDDPFRAALHDVLKQLLEDERGLTRRAMQSMPI